MAAHACQPITAPAVAPTNTPVPPSATPTNFAYLVRITDGDDQPLARAHVLIEVQGAAYFDAYADNNGYIREFFNPTQDEQPARLIVEAEGFRSHRQEIDLRAAQLPKLIILERIGPPTPTPTPILFPPSAEGETLVVVADFVDQQGNDPDRFTRNLVSEVRTTLAGYSDIRIERLMQPIADADDDGSERAMQIGARSDINATIVIWGDYVGTERQPQAHIHFDIVQPVSSYLTSSHYEGYGPVQIAEQPSMFDFTINMGTQLGQVTAFVAGVVLFNADEHLAAEPLFTTAIEVVDQPLATEFSRALRYYRVTNYWSLGRFLEAQPDLDLLKPQSALTADRVDDLDLSILNIFGLVYSALGEKQQALDYYNQALPLRRAVGDKSGEATTLNTIGGVYSALGDKQQALDYYDQALPLSREVGDKAGEATTLNNIGSVYDALGDKQQALDYYNQALPMHREVGNRAMEATTLNNIGLVYADLGEKQHALDYYNQALPLRRAVGDKAGEATTLSNIGSVYYAQDRIEDALRYMEDALAIRLEIRAAWEAVISYSWIGVIYQSRGDLDAAAESLESAITLATELNHPNLPDLQALLAEINAQRGE